MSERQIRTVEFRAVDYEHHAHVILDGRALCGHSGPWPAGYLSVAPITICPKCKRDDRILSLVLKTGDHFEPIHFEGLEAS